MQAPNSSEISKRLKFSTAELPKDKRLIPGITKCQETNSSVIAPTSWTGVVERKTPHIALITLFAQKRMVRKIFLAPSTEKYASLCIRDDPLTQTSLVKAIRRHLLVPSPPLIRKSHIRWQARGGGVRFLS